ncbi:MAG: PE-PPE domain-containing protein [Mycolicibacterium hassiacum]
MRGSGPVVRGGGVDVLRRSLVVVVVALLSVVGVVVSWTAAVAVQLTATALIMGGTQHPLSPSADSPAFVSNYLTWAVAGMINPAAAAVPGGDHPQIEAVDTDRRFAVVTPEEFFPVYGLTTFEKSVSQGLANLGACGRGSGDCVYNDDPAVHPAPPLDGPQPDEDLVIFGYSQSAVIASLFKREVLADRDSYPGVVGFFLVANPMRPNGGILARGPQGLRIPILGIVFYGATPTDSCTDNGPCYPTVDVAVQYDLLGGEAPVSLTNLPAWLNSALSYYYLHGKLQEANFAEAVYQGSHGDTDYYLVPVARLPLLMPFEGFVPSPILTLLDAPLRAAIEAGYARDASPGQLVKWTLLPARHPVAAVVNILRAIPVGIDDAIAEATGDPANRPLGTAPVTGPYGVGGPELPALDAQDNLMQATSNGGDFASGIQGGPARFVADKTGVGNTGVTNTGVTDTGVGNGASDTGLPDTGLPDTGGTSSGSTSAGSAPTTVPSEPGATPTPTPKKRVVFNNRLINGVVGGTHSENKPLVKLPPRPKIRGPIAFDPRPRLRGGGSGTTTATSTAAPETPGGQQDPTPSGAGADGPGDGDSAAS